MTPWGEGYADFWDGFDDDENPFWSDTWAFYDWLDGWLWAYYEWLDGVFGHY